MRVLLLNFILSTSVNGRILRRPSNADTMIYTMARGFLKNGHSVTLLASEEFRPEQPEHNDFEVIYFPSRFPRVFKPYLLPWPKGLRKYLDTHADDFDIVISVETFSMPTLIAARSRIRHKLMIWQEMSYHQRKFHKIPSRIWHNLIARTFLRKIPLVPQSQAAASFISRYIKNVSDTCLYHGADDDILVPADSSSPYFVILSMLVARKRINRIIEKFARFLKNTNHSDFRLKIIGEGPEMQSLKDLTESLGIRDSVDFLGFKNHREYAEIGRHAKAMLVDTGRDLNMVTIPESIVNGTPVVMNTVANTHGIVRDLKLGIVDAEWDWPQLLQAVERYPELHANCILHRDKFTNTGVAASLINEFNEWRSAPK